MSSECLRELMASLVFYNSACYTINSPALADFGCEIKNIRKG